MNYPYDLQPGDIISVRFAGVLRHYGMVTYGGRIISNSRARGGVTPQTLASFAGGRPIKRHGSGAGSSPYLAHARSSKRLGNDYDLTGSNCVHFVRHARGKRPTATQYARGTLMAFGDLLRTRRRR